MAERQHPRFAHAAAITIRRGGGGEGTVDGFTKNVSRGGLCALVPAAVPTGTDVIVELVLIFEGNATSEPLALPARIVWSTSLDHEHQVGMAFRPLAPDAARYLDLFLQFLAARPDNRPGPTGSDDPFGG